MHMLVCIYTFNSIFLAFCASWWLKGQGREQRGGKDHDQPLSHPGPLFAGKVEKQCRKCPCPYADSCFSTLGVQAPAGM